MSSETPRVAIVVGSTRPTRICADIAGWVARTLREEDGVTYEIVDLADVDLPLLDEPLMASLGEYAHDHTRRWSELVSSFDGFVFVFPQYNWGYPAVLKNALDYLYAEWRDKPATVVTYGTRGGGKGAAQLIQVLHGLHMNPLTTHVEVPIAPTDIDENRQLVDVGTTLAPHAHTLRAVHDEFLAVLA